MKLKIRRSRATANLIMALSCYKEAKSPVELSLCPLYHYQYSSIYDALSDLAKDAKERSGVQQAIQSLCMSYFDRIGPLVFQTDSSPVRKPHSPTLKDRGYIAIPNNVIKGNKPLSIGYEVCFVNISAGADKWSLPLSEERVGIDQTPSQKAIDQLGQLLNHPALGLGEELILNTLDSKYGNAYYMAPSWQFDNMVSVVRLRAGMKVWEEDWREDTGGAPQVYGDKFYLHHQSKMKTYQKHPQTGLPYEVFQRSVFEKSAEDYAEWSAQTAKGRKINIQVWRWEQMMIRTKDGHNMKDKPFDLLGVKITDAETGKLVFDREMFLAISGRRKQEVSTPEGYKVYRRRYDIEPFLRFSKQQLLLEKYQTPDVGHFDNWLLFNQLASWLLYTASDEVQYRPRKWEQYLPENKNAHQQARLSMAQTRKAAQDLFLTFDPNSFKPLKSKKGRPRHKGETQIQRTRFPVVRKTTRNRGSPPKK